MSERAWIIAVVVAMVALFGLSLWTAYAVWDALCETYLAEFCEALRT